MTKSHVDSEAGFWRCGPWLIFPARRLILHVEDTGVVPHTLSRNQLRLLLALIKHSDRNAPFPAVVPRWALADEIWGDAMVEYDNQLNKLVHAVRCATERTFIDVVPRTGIALGYHARPTAPDPESLAVIARSISAVRHCAQ